MDSKIFRKVSYGLYVIGSTKEGAFNGQIANTVFQISLTRQQWELVSTKTILQRIYQSEQGFLCVDFTKSVSVNFIGHFGFKIRRDMDKYQSFSYRQGMTGAPFCWNRH